MTEVTVLKPDIALTIPQDATFDDWVQAGAKLSTMNRHLGFMIGDWLNHGRAHFADQLELAFTQAGIDPKYAERAAQVAKLFPVHARAQGLGFDYHRAVAKLPIDEAMKLLTDAEQHKWQIRQLRDAVITKRYETGSLFNDEDQDYYLTREMIRAWNRGTPAARQAFADLVAVAKLETIDEDETHELAD